MLDATPLLRAFARYRLAKLDHQDAVATQGRTLTRLLNRARDTRFGHDHGFASIATVEDFQRQVPLRRYEAFWEEYWRDDFPVVEDATWPGITPYFAKTSGTSSGASKYIPVTKDILRGNRRGVLDMLCFHLCAHPQSRVFGGKNFMLAGSTELTTLAPNVHAGDMSALAARDVPRWARAFYFPPPELAQIADWERRLETLGPLSLHEDIRAIGGTASWLLLFLQGLAGEHGGNLKACYPNLELIVYGGVNFAPYRTPYESLVAGSGIHLREIYAASEGFLAAADRGVGEGLRLQVDGGLFYEFVPVEELDAANPSRFWLGTAETGVNYALVLSSPAGAWAYVLGDTVRFIELDPPRVLVTGRTTSSLSAFGEHLIEEELVRAVTVAAEAIGAAVVDFSVGPVFPTDDRHQGYHLYIVEFDAAIDSSRLHRFTQRLDVVLGELNDDYRDHRAGDMQMTPPEVIAAPRGTFSAWMKARGKLGGQNKVPRVISDSDVLASLRDCASPSQTP